MCGIQCRALDGTEEAMEMSQGAGSLVLLGPPQVDWVSFSNENTEAVETLRINRKESAEFCSASRFECRSQCLDRQR